MRITCLSYLLGGIVLLVLHGSSADAQAPAKVPVLLDTDIGDDIDDAFALALALASPELDIRGITTVHGDAHTRALMVCRLLYAVGRADIPVAAGSPPRPTPQLDGQMQYGLRPCFRKRPEKNLAVPFLLGQLKAHPGELTLLTIGPLTNVAELLTKHPECKPWIKQIVLMGGSVKIGYDGKPGAAAEWNIAADAKSAQIVFGAGVPLLVAPLDATGHLVLGPERRRQIFRTASPANLDLYSLYQLWDKPDPVLFDPVAVALAFTERFCTLENLQLTVDDKGFTRLGQGKPNARVATSIKSEEFLKWFTERLAGAAGETPPHRIQRTNLSRPVAQGNMPDRIHVIEDYETDIERRWWLCGKLEAKNPAPGSKRSCRGVWTNDFDDRMGDARARYTAVIFNPVPGPPMGKNTRLSFRYWLKGTDALKVQIYSLTNGYHRNLVLTDLPQASWQAATADMTACRRPDGSGGPLAEDERIDDIQFYTDADAELIIDDIILHDAAGPEEKRPFPRRPIFTAWFDTGKQGKEWPGTFDIVAKPKPFTWKAAASVPRVKEPGSWIDLSLRGKRPVGDKVMLRFRYHLTGADHLTVNLQGGKQSYVRELTKLVQDQWTEVTHEYSVTGRDTVDRIHFLVPANGRLLVDDVLLYEP